MALTDLEAAILNLLDDGLSVRAISGRGFKLTTVERVQRTYGNAYRNHLGDQRRAASIRRGAAALAAAINAERAAP